MMEVACATDDRYAPHCGSMLSSLLAHNAPEAIRIHVLHDQTLGQQNRERLAQLVAAAGAELNWVPVDQALVRDFPCQRFHISCWYRIVMPELLPEISRMLYLDADILVLDSLKPLWETSLQGHLFAAVANPLHTFIPDRPLLELGLLQRIDYLNSGVLLMDMERMRNEKVSRKILDYSRAHPDNPWPEQDALSVVCQRRWLRLHPRWNVQTSFYDLKDSLLLYPKDESRAARKKPAIVHFIGPHKPWRYLCRHPLRHLYVDYRRRTPWPEFELEGRTWKSRLLRPLSLGMQVKVKQMMKKWRAIVGRWRGLCAI